MKSVEFHFALEGLKGKGTNFLKNSIEESKVFSKSKHIDSKKISWSQLYDMMKKNENI